jgi:hypothetical protein
MKSPQSSGNLSREDTLKEHQPVMAFDPPRIICCSCGWLVPPGTADSDDALAVHVAIAMVRA